MTSSAGPRSVVATAVLVAAVLADVGGGCKARPPVIDDSQRINSGVNIVPRAVLAAERQTPSSGPATRSLPDLNDTISDSDQPHYHLIEVLRNAGCIPLLQEAGPYTIFAPTDAAFDKLPPGTLDELLRPANHAQLVRFVKYHLLTGRVSAGDLLHTNGSVKTVAGPTVIIKGIDAKVMVNDANVIRTDTTASNGVVHWTDGVLMPPTNP